MGRPGNDDTRTVSLGAQQAPAHTSRTMSSLNIEQTERVLGLELPLLRGLLEPLQSFLVVLLHPLTLGVHFGQMELGEGPALLGQAREDLESLGVVAAPKGQKPGVEIRLPQ